MYFYDADLTIATDLYDGETSRINKPKYRKREEITPHTKLYLC